MTWRDNASGSGCRAVTGIKLVAPIQECAPSSHSTEEPLTARRRSWRRSRHTLIAAGLATDLDVRQVNLIGRLDPNIRDAPFQTANQRTIAELGLPGVADQVRE